MTAIITNAFSLNMVSDEMLCVSEGVRIERLTLEQVREIVAGGVHSVVGHADTAAVFSDEIGVTIPCNRESIQMRPETELVVGQYSGPRLPEGALMLPEGATIRWLRVRF